MASHPDWNDLITACLNSTEFMALSTYGNQGLWVNPVYFAWDDHYNLYFISQMDCKHMDNIASNPEVACAIFPTNRPAGDDVFGTYIKGKAKLAQTSEEIVIADTIYYERVCSAGESGEKEADTYRADPSWKFVKISLTGMWYFDTRYFNENRVDVPENLWR